MTTISVQSLSRAGSSMLWHALPIFDKRKGHVLPGHKSLAKVDGVIFTFTDPVMIILSLYRIYHNDVLVKDCGLKGKAFIEAHARNMNARYKDAPTIIEKMFEEDVFNLERMFDAWSSQAAALSSTSTTEHPYKLMMLKYEAMWDHQQEISDFVGARSCSVNGTRCPKGTQCNHWAQVKLPTFVKRPNASAITDEALINQLKQTYKSLREKIEKVEDCTTHGACIG